MTDMTATVQWIVGSILLAGALAGMIADVAGQPVVDPVYYAVAIAAGSAALPTSTSVICRIRRHLPV